MLFGRMRDPSDPLGKPAVVERFLPLARAVARSHSYSDDGYDDVFQVACYGLLKAVERYDLERDIAFSSYAVPTMSGEIKRYFRDRTWSVRPPRAVQDLSLRLERAIDAWTSRHGHPPSAAEIAGTLEVSEAEVLEALQAREGRCAVSLDTPVGGSEEHATIGELIGGEDARLEQAERRVVLDALLRRLPERDRGIVRLRLDHDLTQKEIGTIYGLSQMQVSRILQTSLKRVRILAGAA